MSEQSGVGECSVTISSAPRAKLLSVGAQTLPPFRECKSSLYCPLKRHLNEGKVKAKNQLLCMCSNAPAVHRLHCPIFSTSSFVGQNPNWQKYPGWILPSFSPANKQNFFKKKPMVGDYVCFHSALVIHSYLPAFMSHGSFTLVTET